MESLKTAAPKRKRGESGETPMVDAPVNPEVAAVAERKIVKAKKRVTIQQEQEHKLYDEDGNEIEFEGDEVEEVGMEEDVI